MIAIFLLVLFFAPPALAGGPPVPAPTYEVQERDTLWELAGDFLGDKLKWGKVLGANPFLNEPGRVFNRAGKTIVLIKPGEQLVGLQTLGITPVILPIETLQLPQPVAPSWSVVSAAKNFATNYWPSLLILLALALIALAFRLDRIFRDPATSGEPLVRGGFTPDRWEDIESHFQRIAGQRFSERDPAGYIANQIPQRIEEIEEGWLSGFGTVQYRDRSEVRRLNREPAYRARFRFPNGTEEDLHFLQPCGNDVSIFGRRYLGFHFESKGALTVPVPPPPVAPAAVTPLRVAPRPEVASTIELEGMEFSLPEGSTVRVDEGGSIVVTIGNAEVGIQRVAKKPRSRRLKVKQQTTTVKQTA